MALTPFLAETGKTVANKLDEMYPPTPALAAGGGGEGGGANMSDQGHHVVRRRYQQRVRLQRVSGSP